MDETQPLLRRPDDVEEALSCAAADARIQAENVDDPRTAWSSARRWGVTSLLAFMAFTVTFTCIGPVPIAGDIVADLEGKRNRSAAVLLVTIWELGEAAGPLLIAPLSERMGRSPVINVANFLFIISVAIAALSQSTAILIFSRFLTGCAVMSNVLNPAIIGDVFPSEARGGAMSLVMLAPLMGGAIGPVLSGAIAQLSGWREVLWLSLALAVACEICFLLFFRETYKPAILRGKLRDARQKSEQSLHSDSDDDSPKITLWHSLTRPAAVLSSSIILQLLSIYGALQFSFYYVVSTTLAEILEERYDFTPALVGTSYLSFSVGSCFGIIICNTCVDRIYTRLGRRYGSDKAHPEDRLPLSLITTVALPAVIALYGWVAHLHLPVALLLLAVALLGMVLMLSLVPLMAYVVDAFGLYSASALTAVLITRCLMGTFLPLASAKLVDAIGYGLGFSVLAAACLVLAPTLWLVMFYGREWRQRSEYTRDV